MSYLEEFVLKNKIKVYDRETKFPEYFATHVLDSTKVLQKGYLESSSRIGKRKYSSEVDEYLDSTKYVFFALGKGYLKSANSIGLVYDPFILAKTAGANLVKNDLLYVLNESHLLQNFCLRHQSRLLRLIQENQKNVFINGLKQRKSLLVAVNDDDLAFCNIFDHLLKILPDELRQELKDDLREKIVVPNTIYENLDYEIKKIFKEQKDLLNQFFDETSEEVMPEIRIPDRHRIDKGLIGIYSSK